MSQSFDTLIQQGLQASQSDETELALKYFHEASQAAPNEGLPHFLAAGELAQIGRMQDAEGAYATAILLAPTMAVARYQLGLLQFATDRLPLALTTWQPLLALPEEDFMQQFVQGFFALASENRSHAEQRFRKGLALNTVNPPMNRDIERVLESLAALQAPEAPAETPPVVEDTAAGDEASAHVLLANYQPMGKPN